MKSNAFQAIALAALLLGSASHAADFLPVYVGTYTGGGSKGIYRFDFDPATGKPSNLQLVAESTNPSFLALAPDGKHLYAVNEVDKFEGKPSGSVSAFAVDARKGVLTFLNAQPSMGESPCHLVVDKEGKNVLVSNYGGGSVAVLPIEADGRLGKPSSFIQHKGKVADLARQGGPRGHSVNLDAAGKFAFVADLGLDKMFVYKYDAKTGTIEPNSPTATALAPRSGPRHFAFHPDGHHAYAINEIACSVTAFTYDPENGTLTEIDTKPTLPESERIKSSNSTADIHVHPSGKFLYGSNRGHNSIALFSIDPAGKLTFVDWQFQDIKIPRNFTIDPTGKFLLVANQDGNSVVVFKIDQETGKLTPTGYSIAVAKPVCLQFVPGVK